MYRKGDVLYWKIPLKPEYNISQTPSSPWLGLKHRPESISKMRENFKGRLKTEQHKLSLSLADPNSASIVVPDLVENNTTIYHSMGAAAKDLDISISSISNFFTRKQKKPYKGRYTFSILED